MVNTQKREGGIDMKKRLQRCVVIILIVLLGMLPCMETEQVYAKEITEITECDINFEDKNSVAQYQSLQNIISGMGIVEGKTTVIIGDSEKDIIIKNGILDMSFNEFCELF